VGRVVDKHSINRCRENGGDENCRDGSETGAVAAMPWGNGSVLRGSQFTVRETVPERSAVAAGPA
jgi:hypothetical protein